MPFKQNSDLEEDAPFPSAKGSLEEWCEATVRINTDLPTQENIQSKNSPPRNTTSLLKLK